jgi:hypothetical protein
MLRKVYLIRIQNQPVIEQNSAEEAQSIEPEIEYLRQHMMRSWWWICLAIWLSVGGLSLWWLRSDLQALLEYFTWAALKFMLVYNRAAAMGLGLCFGLTLALLYAESRHIVLGLSKGERLQLTHRLEKIRAQGPSHPQWSVICPGDGKAFPRNRTQNNSEK